MDPDENFKKFEQATLKKWGQQGAVWLSQIPASVNELKLKWNFDFIDTMPDLSGAYLATVNCGGENCVLKMSLSPDIVKNETLWLSYFPHMTPKIYQLDLCKGAFLMQKVGAGLSLKNILLENGEEVSAEIYCNVVRQLHQSSGINDMSDNSLFPEIKNLIHWDILESILDHNFLQKGRECLNFLLESKFQKILLHGDLHHENILFEDEPKQDSLLCKIIDPQGVWGDPAYEFASYIYNPMSLLAGYHNLKELIEKRIDLLATFSGISKERMASWAFCKSLMSLAWFLEDSKTYPEHQLRVAKILAKKI